MTIGFQEKFQDIRTESDVKDFLQKNNIKLIDYSWEDLDKVALTGIPVTLSEYKEMGGPVSIVVDLVADVSSCVAPVVNGSFHKIDSQGHVVRFDYPSQTFAGVIAGTNWIYKSKPRVFVYNPYKAAAARILQRDKDRLSLKNQQ